MDYIEFNGARIWAHCAGNRRGTALILMHTGIATSRMWDTVAGRLGSDHRVIRYDSRGHGRTTTDDSPFSDVDDLLAVMTSMDVAHATLIGASWGGRIAIDAALRHPELVDGLITIGSSPSGFPEQQLTAREQVMANRLDELLIEGDRHGHNRLEAELWAVGTTRDKKDVDPAFLEMSYSLNAENLSHLDEKLTRVPAADSAYARTHEISAPSLFVVGVHDLSPAQAASGYLRSTVTHSRQVRIDGSAHSPTIERPTESGILLTNWLAEHRL